MYICARQKCECSNCTLARAVLMAVLHLREEENGENCENRKSGRKKVERTTTASKIFSTVTDNNDSDGNSNGGIGNNN